MISKVHDDFEGARPSWSVAASSRHLCSFAPSRSVLIGPLRDLDLRIRETTRVARNESR